MNRLRVVDGDESAEPWCYRAPLLTGAYPCWIDTSEGLVETRWASASELAQAIEIEEACLAYHESRLVALRTLAHARSPFREEG